MRNVVETLTELNTVDGAIMPRLALSWKQIDANTWQFSLRKGVKFHDGTDFNADDVKFSLDRARGEKSTNAQKRLFKGFHSYLFYFRLMSKRKAALDFPRTTGSLCSRASYHVV